MIWSCVDTGDMLNELYLVIIYRGSVVFLRKFNDFASRRGHVPKWCTVRLYESVANALICAKGAMPVSRGLPLIVVYALYYAILLYGRWVFDVLTEICVRMYPYTEKRAPIYTSRTWRYMIDRVCVLVNMYSYSRGSQIFVINSELGNLGEEVHCYFALFTVVIFCC